MLSAGNVSLAIIILGPIAWRKYSTWRFEKARSAQATSSSVKRPLFSFPSPMLLPSNLLLSLAFIALVSIHLSYLFHPLQILSRSDLFLLTKTQVSSQILQIRSKVASMSFEELGWKSEWGDEGLETLLRRLGSFEGRKLHLMIGTSPFLSCLYCTVPKDYLLFSISNLLWQFSTNLVLFGILTARFDSLEVFDEIIFSLLELTTRRDMRRKANHAVKLGGEPASTNIRPDGYGYRIPLLYLMGCFALAQASVYLGIVELTFGQGRLDHWHANYNVAFHSALFISTIWIYFVQTVQKTPAMIEIAILIRQSRRFTDETLAHVQASHLTNQIMWGDEGLKEKVSKYYNEKSRSLEQMTCNDTINRISSRLSNAVDTSQVHQSSLAAAKAIWTSTQRSNPEWEQDISHSPATASPPPTPLASSLSR